MLCERCEQRLHQNGENWVLKHCYRGAGHFQLQRTLTGANPLHKLPHMTMYAGASIPGIDINQLIFFGVSIFWRAAAHNWRLLDHRERLDLGPYEERLRNFLMGHQPFPADASLWVNVAAATLPQKTLIFPYGGRLDDYRQYRFGIPGLAFWLHLGGRMPAVTRDMCSVHSPEHFIYLSDAVDASALRDMAKLFHKTTSAANS